MLFSISFKSLSILFFKSISFNIASIFNSNLLNCTSSILESSSSLISSIMQIEHGSKLNTFTGKDMIYLYSK